MIRIIFGFFLFFIVLTFVIWLSMAKIHENYINDLEGYGLPEDQAASIYEQREEEFINWQQLKEKFIDNTEIEEKYENWPDDEPQCVWHSLSERNASHGPLFIPRYLWHGCYNYTNEQAILIYHITEKYDGTDEERMDPNLAMWDYERVNK